VAVTRDMHLVEQHERRQRRTPSANEKSNRQHEELQSINEELETAKEELESGNEELANG